MSEHKYTNALINETSPYLLQHAHNPVQWHPWSDEALQKARDEDKPILLSIGYSSCHWCHVMERESFENEEIAELMNKHFINIKVDREERPDLDAVYMTALQMMVGGGGWPLTVFLTPDGAPFYCGTYFPPEDRFGMPGFRRVLANVAQAYREKRDLILNDTIAIVSELRKSNLQVAKGELDHGILDAASSRITDGFDSVNGGFGQAPKFPPSMTLSFLMRSYQRTGNPQFLEIVDLTLVKMACGGIYDQIGGGFHRYSVDAQWLVPHFEKMLYDNALLSRAYLDAFLLTGNNFYRRITEEILEYVMREMTSPEGGFYSSQDADSDGKEGAFFVWQAEEIEKILGREDGGLFCSYYGVTPEGNFEGKSILHMPKPMSVAAKLNNVPESRLFEVILRGRNMLFAAREKRIKPGRDEKILTAWNGLMLRSFAEAANSLEREEYARTAVRNAEFVISRLLHDGKLLRSYKDGRARFNAYLDDYACMIDGLLSVYEATFDTRWMTHARELAESMTLRFWDGEKSGFYYTSEDHEALIHRPKEFFDGATPSSNAVAAYALLRLWQYTGDDKWQFYANTILQNMSKLMSQHPSSFAHFLCCLDFYLSPPKEIALAGDPRSSKELLRAIYGIYLPNKVVACGMSDDLFLLKNKPQIAGQPTAYVCENFTCKLPITEPGKLASVLRQRISPGQINS
jgi:uncharacterized protein YyaL (SSP411 family)